MLTESEAEIVPEKSTISEATSEAVPGGEMRQHRNEKKGVRWLLDSGSTHHVCTEVSSFHSLDCAEKETMLRFMTGTIRVTHVGTVLLELDGEFGKMVTHICGVLHIPDGSVNLAEVVHAEVDGRQDPSLLSPATWQGDLQPRIWLQPGTWTSRQQQSASARHGHLGQQPQSLPGRESVPHE